MNFAKKLHETHIYIPIIIYYSYVDIYKKKSLIEIEVSFPASLIWSENDRRCHNGEKWEKICEIN